MRRALLAASVLVLGACSGGGDGADLTLTLSADGEAVTVTLANTSSESIRVVRPTVTPNFVLLVITDADGVELPYLGTYKELVPLTEDGFTTLEPGDSTAAEFDLGILFPLETGDYTLAAEYRNPELGTHQGTSAVIFEPGEGIVASPITVTTP